MTEIALSHEFEVKCNECGSDLDGEWGSWLGRVDQDVLVVSPCPNCMEAAADDAREEAAG